MKHRLLTYIASLLFAIDASAGALTDKHDRFTGSRIVNWNSVPSKSGEFAMSAYAFYPKGSKTPYAYGLSLLTWSDQWRFRECNHTNWLIDGTPVPELNFSYKHDSSGSAMAERFELRANRELLERLASAKIVEFKVCGDEGRIGDGDLSGIRQILQATK